MNAAETTRQYLQQQFDVLRAAAPASLFHLSVSIIGGRYASSQVKFSAAAVDSSQRGESEADMETAIRLCIEAGDPKARAAAIRQQIAALAEQVRELES